MRRTNYTGWTVESWLRQLGDFVASMIERDPNGASISLLGWATVLTMIVLVYIWVGG
jgi:hypothetical protein